MPRIVLRVFVILALVVGMGLSTAAPFTASAEVAERKIKTKVAPVYPELAKRMSISGTVKVEVVVLPNGAVKSAKVIGGNPVLVDSAVDAVKKWRYETAAEATTQVVEFKFNPAQ